MVTISFTIPMKLRTSVVNATTVCLPRRDETDSQNPGRIEAYSVRAVHPQILLIATLEPNTPRTPDEFLRDYLTSEVAMMRSMKSVPDINGYCSMTDFVLRNGQPWKPGKDCWALGKRNCFQHAAEAALMERSLTYCEGYAILIIPVLHAWLVDSIGNVIETTWWEVGHAYYGIPFRTDYIRKQIKANKHYSMIDQWESDWPTIRAPKETWLRKL